MTDNVESVTKSGRNLTAPATQERESSRDSTPEPEVPEKMETSAHSMESLISSDSSEGENIQFLSGNSPTGLDGEMEQCDLGESEICVDVDEQDGEGKAPSRRGKRRISKRRERKISLTSSERVMSEIVKIEVIKQGFLMQQGSFQRWNKKYFTITEDRLYISKDENDKLREEIILKDMTVAENSSKNVNHSFTVLLPYHQVVLAGATRKEMEEWVSAFKLAASISKQPGVLETLQHLEGQHSWFVCTHSRPTYCNVCREGLHGVAWHGLSCEVCKFKSHRRCVYKAKQVCKWTTRSSLQESGVQVGQDFAIPHQWLEGNLPTGSKCSICDRACGSKRRLQDFRCLWCKYAVHTECKDKIDNVCTLGDHCLSILPPSALQRSDVIRKGMWEPYQVYGHSPVLACVNSKSGDNLGVKFLRRLKYWLNPAQVFDLAITGPELGLQLFQRFDKFRIIVLGGDGSIGWVLSTVDKFNLHSKCMVGVVPLGTGNDMARVLGWGAQCREEEKLPSILCEMEHSSFKLLDRWSLQYTPAVDVDLTSIFRSHSPPKSRTSQDSMATTPGRKTDASECRQQPVAPFPGPSNRNISGMGISILSPADSVFSHQDSQSSDEYKSAPELTPSPERGTTEPASQQDNSHSLAILSPSDSQNTQRDDIPTGTDQGESSRGQRTGGEEQMGSTQEREGITCASPQNTDRISAFHKSLSDLAHTFSTILISEDEKNVLKSAEILGGVVQDFLSSVVADIESELPSSEFQDSPLVQKCSVLQNKLASLISNLKTHAPVTTPSQQDSPSVEKQFVQREALMMRANSLKKAINSVIDVAEKALDSHAKDMEDLVKEIGSTIQDIEPKSKESVSSITSVVEPVPLLPEMKELCVMNNYLGMGLDAKIAYQFNSTREKKNYKSRTKNMMLYGFLGGKEFFANSQRYLERRINLECDGEPVELPQRLQGLVFLNIPSYMAGTNFWGTEREKDGFSAPSHDDKLMEVVAVSGFTSIATAKVLGIQNHRLKQCRVAKLILHGPDPLAMQVDGEAWLQEPGTIVLSHKNKARMLVKDKAFSQTLESWKQKHSTSSTSLPPPVTSTLHQTLSPDELQHYRELAATVPPLVSYVKAESTINGDVLRDLMPYVSSALQSLERIFQEGGLISDSADILHLEDFERDLKALIQEVHWFLSMQRISSENETPLREAKQVVETHMRKLLSSELSDCSQAHHRFRRGSDTLLMTRPNQQVSRYSPNLPPHRERAAQLIPDETIQAATVVRKIGKEVEFWDTNDVHQWLEGIGMGEHSALFQQKGITGKELIQLKRADFQDMGVTKVSHSTHLYRALQALNQDSPSTLRTQRSTVTTVHHIPRH